MDAKQIDNLFGLTNMVKPGILSDENKAIHAKISKLHPKSGM